MSVMKVMTMTEDSSCDKDAFIYLLKVKKLKHKIISYEGKVIKWEMGIKTT